MVFVFVGFYSNYSSVSNVFILSFYCKGILVAFTTDGSLAGFHKIYAGANGFQVERTNRSAIRGFWYNGYTFVPR